MLCPLPNEKFLHRSVSYDLKYLITAGFKIDNVNTGAFLLYFAACANLRRIESLSMMKICSSIKVRLDEEQRKASKTLHERAVALIFSVSGPFTVDLIAGSYAYECFDAVSGTPVANGVVTFKQGRTMQSSILRYQLSRFFRFHETKENQNTVFNRDIFRRDNSLLSSRRRDEVCLKTLISSAIVMMVIPHANQSPKRT